MHLFVFPILLAWFSFNWPTWLKRGLMAVMVVFSLIHLGMTVHDYHLLNKDMKEFTSGAHLIAPNSAISILAGSYQDTEYHGKLSEISPFYHDTCYYCLGNGSLYIGNYEPKYSYFPLRYREGYWKFEYPGEVDYMLVWRKGDEDEEVVKLREEYELIHRTKNLKLFRLKRYTPPKEDSADVPTFPSTHPIHGRTYLAALQTGDALAAH